jgi:uncharacterized protein YjcR
VAKIRDPARDEAKKIYLENKGITNREIANRLNVDEKKIATWKYRDNWDNTSKKKNVVQQNKGRSTTNKKKQIAKAKAMVISGSTLKEASEQTSVNLRTLETYSAKEKWIDQQEKFMQEVYKEIQEFYTKQHIEDRKLSVTLLHNLMVKTFSEERQGTIDIKKVALRESIANLFIKSIKGQSDILGIPEMKMYIRQDKEDKEEKIKDRVINIKVIK